MNTDNAIAFRLNGKDIRIDSVSPNTTFLDWLRNNGWTGSKEGCAEGDCGACSVAIIDCDGQGKPVWRAINSCLIPLPLLTGRTIVTVEGAGCGKLHPVQQTMIDNHGSQCGYCTPGFIMSMFEGYYRNDLKTENQLSGQLCGNLCRCTGYRAIHDSAVDALSFRADEDSFSEHLKNAQTELAFITYTQSKEKFLRPTSLGELFTAMADYPEARLIAGATELGLEITKRYHKFPVLISVEAISDLTRIHSTSSEWQIGAAVTLTCIEDMLAGEYPEIAELLRWFGSRQIRNRATMGGNIVTASPIGDSAPLLMALEASVVLASSMGERLLPIEDFFIAYRKTALAPNEILKTILIPRLSKSVSLRRKFYKITKRREMDISTVSCCFSLHLDDAQMITNARLAFGGVAAMPARAVLAEDALLGRKWNEETLHTVLPILAAEFTPISDVRGSAAYRTHLIVNLLRKFFYEDDIDTKPKRITRSLPEREPSMPHESGHKHVTGEALYVDDDSANMSMLEVWPICSPHARARIIRRNATAARLMPGIAAVLMAEDVPGLNDVGAVRHDEVLFADKEISYHGQIIALVVGDNLEACRAAAEKVIVEYELLSPIFAIEEAIAAASFHTEPNHIRRGNAEEALQNAPLNFEGSISFGGQDHFYLETNASWAECGEDGNIFVSSSTQHPSEVQMILSHVLDLPMNRVVVECPRMGGGFGGKETQAAMIAALAALAATTTKRKVRVRLNRDQDMMITGKRHPFLAKYQVGFDPNGMLLGAKIDLYSNGGWSLDLSLPVTDRAVFHLDNSYYLPHVDFSGTVTKTNLASNTAFRGFGGPQGMLVIEEIMDRIARQTGLAPELVRARNLYRGRGETNTTHYGQEIEDNRIQRIWDELLTSSDFNKRRLETEHWNAEHPNHKRGIAITPVKFGISFTTTHLNQAGALVLIYQDGTVQINHGGTEMGQGVHTNIKIIAAKTLGITNDRVRVMHTRTDKVPNTSATAASCGTDLNGAAVKDACETLIARLLPFAQELLLESNGKKPPEGQIMFRDNVIIDPNFPNASIPFISVVQRAYFARTSLSATGFYKTPDIHFDRKTGKGKPFHYFSVGAAVSEVEVDGFTGMMKIRRTDILHDAGDPINRAVARGQIEGGFVQGVGWLTCEELLWDTQGRLLTHSPDTYKIPSMGDTPEIFNVEFLSDAAQKTVVLGSKAVGEPPFMLAFSVREALRDAIAAFGKSGGEVFLASPATSEAIYNAIAARISR